jgi:hypothetical protein
MCCLGYRPPGQGQVTSVRGNCNSESCCDCIVVGKLCFLINKAKMKSRCRETYPSQTNVGNYVSALSQPTHLFYGMPFVCFVCTELTKCTHNREDFSIVHTSVLLCNLLTKPNICSYGSSTTLPLHEDQIERIFSEKRTLLIVQKMPGT